MEQQDSGPFKKRNLFAFQILFVGMTGYLLGSFFPAGYINYLMRKTIFPESLVARPVPFDRAKLRGATQVTVQQVLDAVDTNPNKFRADYIDKPVVVSGTIQYFLESSSGEGAATLTLDTGIEYRSVFLTFDDGRQSSVTSLWKGGPVKATCIVTGTTDAENVHMSHCEVTR